MAVTSEHEPSSTRAREPGPGDMSADWFLASTGTRPPTRHTPAAARWRRGVDGEEGLTARLDDLPRPAWVVVRDLPIDATDTTLDHLVIGPPRSFTVTSHPVSDQVVVIDGRHVFVDGVATSWLRDAEDEAARVRDALRRATGIDPWTWPVLVLDGCRVTVRERPSEATVLTSTEVPGWFLSQARTRHLSPEDVLALEHAAGTPATWPTAPKRRGAPTPLQRRRPAAVSVTHWPRFGHDRWYVTLADGTTLGHLDASTGTLHVDRPEDVSLVRAVLRANYAPLR